MQIAKTGQGGLEAAPGWRGPIWQSGIRRCRGINGELPQELSIAVEHLNPVIADIHYIDVFQMNREQSDVQQL